MSGQNVRREPGIYSQKIAVKFSLKSLGDQINESSRTIVNLVVKKLCYETRSSCWLIVTYNTTQRDQFFSACLLE